MITTHKKNSYKLSLLGIVAVLLLGGCALTMPKSSEQPLAKSQGILQIDDVESVQIIGGIVDRKPRTLLYTNESSSGKQMISNIVSWVNAAVPVKGATEFGKHGYPDTIQIERTDSSDVRIEHAYNCVVSPVKENGTATKSCSPVDGEVVLTKDSVKTRLASSELFEWLKRSGSNDAWNYKEGFVIAKEGQKILMVRYDLGGKTVGQILKESQPAIWISVKDKSQYDSIVLGDKVSVKYEDIVIIDQSYPAQTSSANEIIRITRDDKENADATIHVNEVSANKIIGAKNDPEEVAIALKNIREIVPYLYELKNEQNGVAPNLATYRPNSGVTLYYRVPEADDKETQGFLFILEYPKEIAEKIANSAFSPKLKTEMVTINGGKVARRVPDPNYKLPTASKTFELNGIRWSYYGNNLIRGEKEGYYYEIQIQGKFTYDGLAGLVKHFNQHD